jgi:hypothetical protein
MKTTTNTATQSAADFTRAQLRRFEEAVEHVASVLGACIEPTALRDELTMFSVSEHPDRSREQANQLMAEMEAAGVIQYDPETCAMTIPMG